MTATPLDGDPRAVQEYVATTIEHYEDHLRAPLEFQVAPGG